MKEDLLESTCGLAYASRTFCSGKLGGMSQDLHAERCAALYLSRVVIGSDASVSSSFAAVA